MQLLFIVLLDVIATHTCVNKLLHVFNIIATVLKITQAYGVRVMDITLRKTEDTEQWGGSSRGIQRL